MSSSALRRGLLLLGTATAACAAPSAPPANNAPARSENVQAPPGPSHDDANSCVEASIPLEASEDSLVNAAAFEQRVEARLQTLKRCSAHLTQASTLVVLLEPGPTNRVEHVLVTASSTDDCEAISCVKQGLVGVEGPPPAAAPASPSSPFAEQVSLLPHAAPTVQHPPRAIAEPLTPSCLDKLVAGRLPPELIQSVVRAHYDKFRRCYEAGLGRNPRLTGRVAVRFVIGRDGGVSYSSVAENTLPDCQVATCVRNGFRALSFPPPDGGMVTVVYPIMLEPG